MLTFLELADMRETFGTYTHARLRNRWMVWGTFLELARMQDAPQLMVWGGVGMMTFLELTHMGDATQLMVWGGWGIMTFLLLHTCEMLQNVLSPRIWDYVHQFVYRRNTDP